MVLKHDLVEKMYFFFIDQFVVSEVQKVKVSHLC